MKKLLIFIPLLIFAATTFAQSTDSAKLLDEFGKVHCDEFKARIDNFYLSINADPTSRGFFVISGTKDLLAEKLGYELLFESVVATRAFDRSRVTIVRGEASGPISIKLWIVRASDDVPDLGNTGWSLRFSLDSPPLLLRSDMQQICDPPPVGKVARELLDANPDGSIFVVVHGSNPRARNQQLAASQNLLKSFDAVRVRYFLRRSPTAYSDYYFAIGDLPRTAFKS